MHREEATEPGRGSQGGWEVPAARRSRLLAAVLAAVAIMAVAVAVVTSQGGAEPVEVGEATPDGADGAMAFGQRDALPDAPGHGRAHAASAWTGTEWLLWGGFSGYEQDQPPSPLPDGLAYDPEGERWRVLPEPPLEARSGAAVVWAGDRLVIWGGIDASGQLKDDGAAYVPADDRWELLPPAPGPARAGAEALWVDGEVVILGGLTEVPGVGGRHPLLHRDVLALDPETGDWAELAALPEDVVAAVPFVTFVVAGDRLLAWQRERGWVYLPQEDRWEPTPLMPPDTRARAGTRPVALDGRQVLVLGARRIDDQAVMGKILDLDEGWGGPVGQGVALAELEYVRAVGGPGGALVLLPDGPHSYSRERAPAMLWDRDLDRWLPLPRALVRDRSAYMAAWTGEELLVWGGVHLEDRTEPNWTIRDDGFRWRLSD